MRPSTLTACVLLPVAGFACGGRSDLSGPASAYVRSTGGDTSTGGKPGTGGTLGIVTSSTGGEVATGGTTSIVAAGVAKSISAGDHHACAALQDGSVRCWGGNTLGELGDGTTTDSAVPATASSCERLRVQASSG